MNKTLAAACVGIGAALTWLALYVFLEPSQYAWLDRHLITPLGSVLAAGCIYESFVKAPAKKLMTAVVGLAESTRRIADALDTGAQGLAALEPQRLSRIAGTIPRIGDALEVIAAHVEELAPNGGGCVDERTKPL